jgi:glycosyltransferase involved in cell wall biosynthesis
MKPILTIFIPTYNRALQLENTIYSIISQDGFENCELVISDNGSTDDTSNIANRFTAQYDAIRYFSNDVNIGFDENCLKAFEYAKGNYIEFLSDKSLLLPGALLRILDVIEQFSPPHLFISNGHSVNKIPGIIECNSLSDYVRCVSYWSTWISGMVFKKSAIDSIGNLKLAVGSSLIQTDWAFRVVAVKKNTIVLNEKMISEQSVGAKAGYNLFTVFVNNYLGLFNKYILLGDITRQDVFKEESRLLIKFIFPWYIDTVILKKHAFDLASTNKVILNKYWKNPILYSFPIYLIYRTLQMVKAKITKMKKATRIKNI